MKKRISFIVFFISLHTFSQMDVKTHLKNIENGYEFYADNNEVVPVSIKVSFTLKNLKSSEGNDKIFLLPANTKNIKLTTLSTIKNGKYGVSSETWYNHGDHFLTEYDKDYEYNLPFEKGGSHSLSQGYNGHFSHQNKNQLDFTMPIGTKILAVRDGVVVKVVDSNTKNCSTQECEKFNNYIIIYHKDGTFSEYAHINTKGAKVKAGDIIEQGQFIAESGNIGWSSGPHLHFSVYLQRIDGKRESVKTKFKLEDGLKSGYLVEKEKYTRNYN
ncbi:MULTISPECIES: M23 family metallopeptidase [unclassified Lacinutrix]